jgi:hypothetical protein
MSTTTTARRPHAPTVSRILAAAGYSRHYRRDPGFVVENVPLAKGLHGGRITLIWTETRAPYGDERRAVERKRKEEMRESLITRGYAVRVHPEHGHLVLIDPEDATDADMRTEQPADAPEAVAEALCPNGGRFAWDITYPGDTAPWDEGEGDAAELAAMLKFTAKQDPEHGMEGYEVRAPGHLVIRYADGTVSNVRTIA